MNTVKAQMFLAALVVIILAGAGRAEVNIDGFLQGLYGGRLDNTNPTATEFTASESRLQLRLEQVGEKNEVFGRLDFTYDAADSARFDVELREAYLKTRLGDNFDLKIGRQVLTWGTGDLIFINDVFAKDYQSFFVGRDDQYLKAPQNALRAEYYGSVGSLALIWTPRFEPNRLPDGRTLSYFNPFVGQIVGQGYDASVPLPPAQFKNGEIAARFSRQVGGFNTALYAYHGFYKNPMGAMMTAGGPMPIFPRLNVYGASLRGQVLGGIVWLEGGYFDSRQDQCGANPLLPNASATAMLGFERQVATNLTVNGQWQAEAMMEYDRYKTGQASLGGYVRDEISHLLTTRITQLLHSELVTLSAFVFYSPSDEDLYARLYAGYKYTDEVAFAVGANIFDGQNQAANFGQFQKNDNVYIKVTFNY